MAYGVMAFIDWLGDTGADYTKFKHGKTQNLAGEKERAANREYLREQRAKGGVAGQAGWNKSAREQQQPSTWVSYQNRAGTALQGQVRGTSFSSQQSGMVRSGGMITSSGSKSGPRPTKAHIQETYPLGMPSLAWWEKFGRWGPQGPVSGQGWRATLTRAPRPRSTTAPSQRFKQEVIQTRETRKDDWTKPFNLLPRHTNTPRLNPNLAYMYRRKSMQLGAVRRTTRKFF